MYKRQVYVTPAFVLDYLRTKNCGRSRIFVVNSKTIAEVNIRTRRGYTSRLLEDVFLPIRARTFTIEVSLCVQSGIRYSPDYECRGVIIFFCYLYTVIVVSLHVSCLRLHDILRVIICVCVFCAWLYFNH